jgi:non-ribosomal peptide synthetase component F
MYTSGSTGTPKGVVVTHESVINTLRFLQDHYPVAEDDCYLLKTNYAFDVSVLELFGWFAGLGSLEILPPGIEVPVHLPLLRWKRDYEVGQAFTGPCQQICDVAPRFDTAAAAGLENAQSGGIGRRALLGAGAVGDPPGNNGIA